MRYRIPKDFKLQEPKSNTFKYIELKSSNSLLSIEFLHSNIACVRHTPAIFKENTIQQSDIHAGSLLDSSSSGKLGDKRELAVSVDSTNFKIVVAPQASQLARVASEKRDLSSFESSESLSSSAVIGSRGDLSGKAQTSSVSGMQVEVNYGNNDLTLSWSCSATVGAPESVFLEDLPHRAYEYDAERGCHHYLKHADGHKYYGLGEKTGPGLCLNERSFKLATSDSMGYNSERTDPLYKHIPWYIGLTKDGKAYGVFYNTAALGSLDFACEIDALWGSFTCFKSEAALPLEYYIIYGPSVKDVTEYFSMLVGTPALIPKYAFGYLASAMGYAEAENAQKLLEEFPEKLKKHSIPCDVLHLSSGYTVDPHSKQRNVFTWNRFAAASLYIQSLQNVLS